MKRDRKDGGIRLAALPLPPALGEALGGEPVQDRVDLAVALAPEVCDGPLDQLLDVVTGHGAAAQHPEDRVPARVRPPRRRLARPPLTPMHLEDTYPPDLKSNASAGWRSVVLFQHEQLALAPDARERAPVDR